LARKALGTNLRIVQYGLGSIGCGIARRILGLPGCQLAGAIDVDPQKVGRDIGEVLGLERKLGAVVSADASVLRKVKAELVLHSTASHLKTVRPQLVDSIESGCSVISTCEELVYPNDGNRKIAEEIDRLAKRWGVAVLGIGVNPGFVMDALPLILTSVCQDVKKIKATRIVDASRRRLPLQKKIGAGISVREFEEGVSAGAIGHVGLRESANMIADALGWELDGIAENIEPVVARKGIQTQSLRVGKGMVAGIKQTVRCTVDGEEVMVLELQMRVDAEDPHDSVFIDGIPPVDMIIRGGIHGDSATIAIVINAIPRVLASKPGLITVRDLPILTCTRNLSGGDDARVSRFP